MVNLKNSQSSLDLTWRRLEGHLTANSPHLWGLQIHIVLLAATCGLVFCVVLQLMFASPQLAAVQVWLAGLLMLLQLSFLAIWLVRMIAVPRPSNALGYSSPPLVIIALCMIAIMIGPTVLFALQVESIGHIPFLVFLLVGEVYFFAALVRFIGGLGQQPNVQSLVKWGALSFLLISTSYSSLVWLLPGTLGLVALTLFFVVVGAGRLSFCIVSGSRRPSDSMWLANLLLLPFAVASGWVTLSAINGIDVLGRTGRHLSEQPIGIWALLILILVIAVSCWVDFVSWIRAHLMMLPVKE